jgi:hypothetical protein
MTSGTQNGYAGGLVVRNRGETSTTNALNPLLSQPTDLTITRDATGGTVTAAVIVRGLDGSITSPNATLQLGTGSHGASFFNDDATFITGTTNGKGTLSSDGGNKKIRNTTALLTTGAVNLAVSKGIIATPQPFDTSACKCDFMTFGYWQTTITEDPGHHHHGGHKMDIITQAPWVAGQVAAAAQLPNTQSATYKGVMLGQAQNAGGSIRNVTGSYDSSWSFAARVGSFNASFDNRSYTGGIVTTPGSGGASFVGGITGGGNVGSVSGSFFTSPGQAPGSIPAGQAGKFGITGPGYVAGGVFAGSKQ